MTEVAHRHHVTRQQIYTWRSELRKKGLLSPSTNAVFIPVDMSAVQTEQHGDQQDRSGMIELRLPRGRSLCFDSGVNASVLRRLIRPVESGMIGPGTGVRVYLACGVTDMRNYAATMIMWSRRG
ncbi:IS66 family insertion sequence element accessory protein TnpB [Sinorhizobium medicae]|uniref:IS66 family insertion sequence element accessory protein TnpB n=1 Tax=Sinorhizobium medicae TaxID=110321 RepID=UPI001F3A77E2